MCSPKKFETKWKEVNRRKLTDRGKLRERRKRSRRENKLGVIGGHHCKTGGPGTNRMVTSIVTFSYILLKFVHNTGHRSKQ